MESMARRKKSRRKVFDRFQKKITPTVSQDGVPTTLFLDLKDLVANIVGWTNLLSDSQIQLCLLCSIPSGAPTIRFNSESMIGATRMVFRYT